MGYHEDKAAGLGLKILTSATLDGLLKRRANLYLDNDVGDFATKAEVGGVVCDRDEGYVSAILEVLGAAKQAPGRTTWVLGSCEETGYDMVYIFACDSVKAACKLVRADIAALDSIVKKAA